MLERISITAKATSRDEKGNADNLIRAVNHKLDVLSKENEGTSRLSDAFNVILSSRISGIKITGLFHRKESKEDAIQEKIIVRGISPDRDRLIAFVGELERELYFLDVNLPIDNLLASVDISFSITVVLAD